MDVGIPPVQVVDVVGVRSQAGLVVNIQGLDHPSTTRRLVAE
jgi:hypothetical protein